MCFPVLSELSENIKIGTVKWFFSWVFNFLHFSFYFWLALLSCLFVTIHCFWEIFDGSTTSTSYGLTWGLLLGMLCFFLLPPIYAFFRRRNYKFVYRSLIRPVYEDLKKWHIFTNLHLYFYVGKRVIIGFFIALLANTNHWARTLVIFFL